MELEHYITALKNIDGMIWRVIGAMEEKRDREKQTVKKENPFNYANTGATQVEGADLKILEGTIIHRKDGRWETRLTIAGKQVTTACGKKKSEVIEKHNNEVREQRKLRKQLVAPTQYTLKSWVLTWFETYKKEKIESWKNYERTINKHVLPNCPDVKLSKVTELVITNVLNKMPTDRIRKDCYLVFNQCLHVAYTNRMIQWDVAAALTKPKVQEGEGRALTKEEVAQLLELAKDSQYRPVLEWYLVTGCRPRELFYISLSDVGKDYIRIPGTKTATSKRIVPIFKKTRELLREDLSNGTQRLIGTATYEGLKTFIRRLNDANGTDFKIKDLRTTFGTRCAEQGIAPKVIAKWMGHSKAETTNKYYIKVLDKYEQEEAKKFTF